MLEEVVVGWGVGGSLQEDTGDPWQKTEMGHTVHLMVQVEGRW